MEAFDEKHPKHEKRFHGIIESTGDGRYVGVAANGEVHLLKFIRADQAQPEMLNLILGEDEIHCLAYLLNQHLAGRQPGS